MSGLTRYRFHPQAGNKLTGLWSPAILQAWMAHLSFDPEKKPLTHTDFLGWAIMIGYCTGLRFGEICGLLTNDLNLRQCTLIIRTERQPLNAVMDLDQTAGALLARLVAHRMASDRMFAYPADNLLHVYIRERRRLSKTLPDVAPLNMYDLRYTYARALAMAEAA